MASALVQNFATPTPDPFPRGRGEYSRRGACPGLSVPMQTGDGLLVRLPPIGTIALDAFGGLCAAAKEHGSGIVEITARGSVQVRGLSVASAPLIAERIATLGIAAQDGVPVLIDPLAGIGAAEIFDAAALAVDLRGALAQSSLAGRLSPKVSVVIDGGGSPNLDTIAADVRLRAELAGDEVVLRVSVGGDAFSGLEIGAIAPSHGVEAATQMLEVIVRHGRAARARDVVAAGESSEFRSTIADNLISARPRAGHDSELDSRLGGNERRPVIGLHHLRDGSFACGIGLAFGHAHATALEHLMEAASVAGANGVRPAPGRTLIIIGLPRGVADTFAASAERIGFIVRANDPRRNVIACGGAPLCVSGHIAARAVAPRIAEIVGSCRDASVAVHISGCNKGCAHPAPAALTIVGTAAGCGLVANGTARDAPFAVVSDSELAAAVADHAATQTAEQRRV